MNCKTILYILIVWISATLVGIAQVDLYFGSDSTAFELGSPFSVQLTLRFDPETDFRGPFPDLKESIDFDLEILESGSWDTISVEPLIVLTRNWTLMAFDTGTLMLKTMPLPYTYNFIPDTATAKDYPINIYVTPNDQQELYPIKDLERTPVKSWNWLWVLGIIMLAIIIALLIRHYYLNKKNRKIPEPEAPTVPQIRPLDKAILALEELRPKIDSRLFPEETFYVELSKIIKGYLQERTHNNVTGWTSTETLDFFKKILSVSSLRTLKALLNQSDMVKFANASTEEEAREAAIRISIDWLKSTDPTLWRQTQYPSSEKNPS